MLIKVRPAPPENGIISKIYHASRFGELVKKITGPIQQAGFGPRPSLHSLPCLNFDRVCHINRSRAVRGFNVQHITLSSSTGGYGHSKVGVPAIMACYICFAQLMHKIQGC